MEEETMVSASEETMVSASEDTKSGIGVEIHNPERDNIRVNNPGKRKRVSAVESMTPEERDAKVGELRQELEGLFKYYKELVDEKMNLDVTGCATTNMAVACLLEESSLAFSKLVSEIYEKMKEIRDGSGNGVTIASVKTSVHFVGQRSSYGLTNVDADLFEDEDDSCLWCWETRDMKLLPRSSRGMIKIRRACKKKIHERITAVTDMITALQKFETLSSCGRDMTKASERLCKVLNEADIRLLAQSMVEKNSAHMGDKEVKQEEKKLIKEMEKIKWEEERKKKRMNLELMKEKMQNEKELKRLQSEALKEERKREREEAEHRKQLKRKQEDDEKDQRRRAKEEAVQKQQSSLQKQASLMNRFLKRSKNSITCPNGQLSSQAIDFDSPPDKRSPISESVTLTMDNILSRKDDMDADGILKAHMISWRRRNCIKQHWGMRQKPKSDVTKNVKLSTSKPLVGEDELNLDKLDGAWDETHADERSDNAISDASVPCIQRPKWHKQLLQFDKSNRPAFYGIRTKKSQVIGPRRPFKKDQDLDYEIDSDEEWEEEEPGESLSDCDKDEDEEILEEGCLKVDGEDDSEDEFFVPDGYLSENEGVQVSGMESDCIMDEADCKIDPENEQKMHVLLRHQKHMYKLTEHALRRNQPLIISNIKHEKASLMMAEDLSGTAKLEQLCLQALSMCPFPGGLCIDISVVDNRLEEDNSRLSTKKETVMTPRKVAAISELDLPEIVSTIQSCQHGMKKVLESLHQKFPTIPKAQLKTKVREISDFVDNRWQVKKDVLKKLGFSISPEKSSSSSSSGRTKSIAAFFSKRCLPPTASDGKKSNKSNANSSLENTLPKASTPPSTPPALSTD